MEGDYQWIKSPKMLTIHWDSNATSISLVASLSSNHNTKLTRNNGIAAGIGTHPPIPAAMPLFPNGGETLR